MMLNTFARWLQVAWFVGNTCAFIDYGLFAGHQVTLRPAISCLLIWMLLDLKKRAA